MTFWAQVWRQALAVALGVVAAAAIIVPGVTVWNELVLKPDISSLGDEVRSSMEQSLRNDDTYRKYALRVDDVVLVGTGENTYTGQATVQPASGPSHEVQVTVTYDGDHMMWQTAPGAFLWLTQ